jgi:cyclopropane fatty-acyl-phospholipid synthase-like methyltransferase
MAKLREETTSDRTALPCSEACERNKGPILAILKNVLAAPGCVLEIGAGTGQHAVHFARHLPHLEWLPTDRSEWLEALRERVRCEGPPNLQMPVEVDVNSSGWPIESADAVYSANTLHIMAWPEVEAFFRGAGRTLAPRGRLAVYGPFRFEGRYTSASNAEFDAYLRRRDPASGVRDFEAVDALAAAAGLQLGVNHAMPANNHLLVWQRSA